MEVSIVSKAGTGLYLEGKCLVAMPGLQDGFFNRSVVYICAHSEDGAMGIILNHPAEGVNFVDLLLQLKVIEAEERPRVAGETRAARVLAGGPVDASRGFVLHSPDYSADDATMPIDAAVSMTATLDVLRAMARGKGPKQAVLALGYAGWSPGQLEQEILANSWMICPADSLLVFDQEYDSKYERALGAIGVDLRFLSDDAGHA
ncbi:YqgE/AlgH family protein [uncultured Rhodoblastus sp.]|uniref:YqgE/AlgH family protein n=1 Tax=uncultured Rhodoblastus sp. TaxID=543037 RepID=UPI0025EEF31B|nr:YqgE/AlgH family protein [uncultured Rhodoblastus sp.]